MDEENAEKIGDDHKHNKKDLETDEAERTGVALCHLARKRGFNLGMGGEPCFCIVE